ncbi:MAG: pseudouridine synthase, partial [Planctomycetota bacterium]
NDGNLIQVITNPKYNISKTYRVKIDSFLQPHDIEKMAHGTYLSEGKTKPLKIKIIKRSRTFTICIVSVIEGKNREIRRIFAKFGYKVKRLKRIAIGKIPLQPLAPGCYKEVNYDYIINRLK